MQNMLIQRMSLGLIAIGPVLCGAWIAEGEVVTSLSPEQVELNGRLGARYNGTTPYLIALHDQAIPQIAIDMLEPYENRGAGNLADEWDGEYAGKWLDAAALMAPAVSDPGLTSRVQAFTASLIATQLPSGYLGIDAVPGGGWDLWNNWYALAGLLSAWEATGDTTALQSAIAIGEYLVANYQPPGEQFDIFASDWGGGCNVAILDQLVRLRTHTQDPALLDLEEHMVAGYWAFDEMRDSGLARYTHAYVLAAILGGVTAHTELGDGEELPWVESVWDDIVQNHLLHTFGLGRFEVLSDPASYLISGPSQETCATVEWLLWTDRLYRATGDPRFVDAIEETVYNALFGAQSIDGMQWMYYTKSQAGAKFWLAGPTSCCFWSGPRGIARLPGWVSRTDAEGIRIDLYENGAVDQIEFEGATIRLDIQTDYPSTGEVDVIVSVSEPAAFALKLRLPSWARDVAITIDGSPVSIQAEPGDYAALDRTWVGGERVGLRFDLPASLRTRPGMTSIAGSAIRRGPEVLSFDVRDNPGLDINSVTIDPNPIVLDDGVSADGRRVYRTAASSGGEVVLVRLTPFADAGGGARYKTIFPVAASPVFPGDLNLDLTVDTADLGALVAKFGSGYQPADINGDGTVDTADLGVLISNFGNNSQ